jgi:hypothetical protein
MLQDVEKSNICGDMYKASSQVAPGSEKTRAYLVKFVRSLDLVPESQLAASADDVASYVAERISATQISSLDGVVRLNAVQNLANTTHKKLFELLSIFASGGVKEFQAFNNANKDLFTTYKLDVDSLQAKMRMLQVCSVCMGQQEVSLASVMEALGTQDRTEAESVVIQTIVNKGISGKLNEERECVTVYGVTPRSFTPQDDWANVSASLSRWINNVDSVLSALPQLREQVENLDGPQQEN